VSTTSPLIAVHFSPQIIKRIGSADTKGWADVIRDWHHYGDSDRNFGRNVSNSNGVKNTWAWHMHMAPETLNEQKKWDREKDAYRRTSDRLVVYSMAQDVPMTYGILLLSFLTPNGHDLLVKGPNAAKRREDWEDIAYTHQATGQMPPGTITEP
jgi:hypothetical protein